MIVGVVVSWSTGGLLVFESDRQVAGDGTSDDAVAHDGRAASRAGRQAAVTPSIRRLSAGGRRSRRAGSWCRYCRDEPSPARREIRGSRRRTGSRGPRPARDAPRGRSPGRATSGSAPGYAVLAGLVVGTAAIALARPRSTSSPQGDTGYILLMAVGRAGGLVRRHRRRHDGDRGVRHPQRGALPGRGPDAATARARPADRCTSSSATGTVMLVASRRAARDRLVDALDEVARSPRASRPATPGSRSCSPRPGPASGSGTSRTTR